MLMSGKYFGSSHAELHLAITPVPAGVGAPLSAPVTVPGTDSLARETFGLVAAVFASAAFERTNEHGTRAATMYGIDGGRKRGAESIRHPCNSVVETYIESPVSGLDLIMQDSGCVSQLVAADNDDNVP